MLIVMHSTMHLMHSNLSLTFGGLALVVSCCLVTGCCNSPEFIQLSPRGLIRVIQSSVTIVLEVALSQSVLHKELDKIIVHQGRIQGSAQGPLRLRNAVN